MCGLPFLGPGIWNWFAPKLAGWGRRPRVFSCTIRCKLHLGPNICNTFPLWNSLGKALSMIRARPSTRLLCLHCYFQKGTDSVHRLFPLHMGEIEFNTCKPYHTNSHKYSTEGCAAFWFPPNNSRPKIWNHIDEANPKIQLLRLWIFKQLVHQRRTTVWIWPIIIVMAEDETMNHHKCWKKPIKLAVPNLKAF